MEKLGFHRVSSQPNKSGATIHHNIPFMHKEGGKESKFHKELKVDNSPSNQYVLLNQAAVSDADFPEVPSGTPVLLDGRYVYSIKKDIQMEPGKIGLGANMRQWGKWSLGQRLQATSFNVFEGRNQSYLGTIELKIDFRLRNKAHHSPLNHDELAGHFLYVYENQILQPTEPLVMEYKGDIFQIVVLSVQVIDINRLDLAGSLESSADLNQKGILMKQTQVSIYPHEGSVINIVMPHGSTTHRRPRNKPIINPDFKLDQLGIGGLDEEFSQIFRRAFASRIISPELVSKLALRHVKGLLLYGPPGTGKTLIARQIGRMLNVKEPKVVNGPEMLSKFVGASEENIRKLFKDAETEFKQKGEESQLHIIIFDELDSVFKHRGSGKSDGTGVGDNVVNQLLAKMDGVDELNNILIIGMTNRLDLIDGALLRPGRFEIQIEISLPDEKGRKDILHIHTKNMRENNLLSDDVDFDEIASLTKNYTGAELEGLCNSAASFAINKFTKGDKLAQVDESISTMKLTREDFLAALNEVKPAFGVDEEDLTKNAAHGIIDFSPLIDNIFERGISYLDEVRTSETERLISILLHGPPGSGKTAIASTLALNSLFPFVKLLSAESLIGMSEPMKIAAIDGVFRDVYKSPLSILVVDQIETLINFVPIGPRFSNDILQTLLVSFNKQPPNGRRLLIIGTTSQYSVLKHMNMLDCFTNTIGVTQVTKTDELLRIMTKIGFMDEHSRHAIVEQWKQLDLPLSIGIKKLLQVLMNCKYLKADTNTVVENLLEAHVR